MNSEREKADILFDYGLPLQFCCHLIQFYTLLFLRVATLNITIYMICCLLWGIVDSYNLLFFITEYTHVRLDVSSLRCRSRNIWK